MAPSCPTQRAAVPRFNPVIFVTVGGPLPFDRLVHTVDRWAKEQQRREVFAQIGDSTTPPNYIEWQRFLSPSEFQAKARQAEFIIAHAGMGSILTAIEVGKALVIMPRRAHLGEHRNDHQWATVRRLADGVGVTVAADEGELLERLARLEELSSTTERRSHDYKRLLEFLRSTIEASE